MTTDTTTPYDWTYIGQRLDHKGKAHVTWLDGGGEERWFDKPLTLAAAVGGVYRINLTAEGAEHEHAKARIEAERARKRAVEKHRGDLGRMTLSEAAAWYHGHTLPHQKAGALAVLIQYIHYGR